MNTPTLREPPIPGKIIRCRFKGADALGLFLGDKLIMCAIAKSDRWSVYDVDGRTATFVADLPDFVESCLALQGAAAALGRALFGPKD